MFFLPLVFAAITTIVGGVSTCCACYISLERKQTIKRQASTYSVTQRSSSISCPQVSSVYTNYVQTQRPQAQLQQATRQPPTVASTSSTPSPQTLQTHNAQSKKKQERTMFGHYECECGRKWMSSHAWEGYRQECVKCKSNVLPSSLHPKQLQVEYSYECSMCSKWISICNTDANPQSPLFQDVGNVKCIKCTKVNRCLRPELMRINDALLAEYVGKCLHCSKDFVVLAKPMTSHTTIKCKH
jgi:hypothetical protein